MKKKSADSHGREKKFLELPEYPGGKEAFQKFIKENLRYPKEAMEQRIEGVVHIQYWVDGSGKVIEAEVTHGIGHGCDEEALRLVKMLRFGRVKNRGLRIRASMRTRIDFKLPPQPSMKYQYQTTKKAAEDKPQEKKKNGGSFTYTVTISPNKPN